MTITSLMLCFWRNIGCVLSRDLPNLHDRRVIWLDVWESLIVSHYPVKPCSHWHGGTEYIIFLMVEEQDSTCWLMTCYVWYWSHVPRTTINETQEKVCKRRPETLLKKGRVKKDNWRQDKKTRQKGKKNHFALLLSQPSDILAPHSK